MTTMDDGARYWMVKTAKANYWRVASWYELDDLIQDGMLCWWRIVDRYETKAGRVRARRHLMRLFQRTYTNHIHDLAKARTHYEFEQKISDVLSAPIESEARLWHVVDNDGGDLMAFERLIAEAPRQLRALIGQLLSDGESPTLQASYRVRRDGTRETLGERFARMVGDKERNHNYPDTLRRFLRA